MDVNVKEKVVIFLLSKIHSIGTKQVVLKCFDLKVSHMSNTIIKAPIEAKIVIRYFQYFFNYL